MNNIFCESMKEMYHALKEMAETCPSTLPLTKRGLFTAAETIKTTHNAFHVEFVQVLDETIAAASSSLNTASHAPRNNNPPD